MVTHANKKIRRSLVFIIGLVVGISITYAFLFQTSDRIECPGVEECQILESLTVQESDVTLVNNREYFPAVFELLSSAEDSIDMSMFEIKYYFNYPESDEMLLLKELVAAKKRGVDIRILTDQFYTNPESVKFLKKNGIDVKYDSTKKTTHTKLIIVDGELVLIGSTNWSYYSINKNHEANVIIKSKEVAGEFTEYFEKLWDES